MKNLRILPYLLNLSLVVIALFQLSACGGGGGGGGGDDQNNDLAADVFISVSPGTLDTGDRTTVEVLIENLNPDGAAIKVRFPVALKYLSATSELESDDDIDEIAPTNNVSDEDNTYLVYYIRSSQLDNGRGTLRFKLQGVDVVEKGEGEVEVDADLDDPTVSNQDEFSIEAPAFAAQDSDGIIVNGE